MSYLLEALGRGLLSELRTAFQSQLPDLEGDEAATLQQRAAMSPKSADLALRLGTVYLREEQFAQARESFENARRNNPASAKPLLGLACVADGLGDYEQAIKLLAAAQSRDPDDPAIAFSIAFSHERLERRGAAQAEYRRALAACPQLRNAYERLAAIAIREADWDQAIEQYEQLVDMDPGDLDAVLTLGNLYLQVGRSLEAIEQYQRALFIEPETGDDPPTDFDLSDEHQLQEAVAALEKVVRKYPGVAPFHVHLGDLYVKCGEDNKAVEQYQCALDTHPNFLEATVKLGTQHMRQGRFVDAALSFNRAVELNDRLMTAFIGLGCAQHASGRTNESLATFDLAAALEPSTTLLFSESNRLQLQTEHHQRHVQVEQMSYGYDAESGTGEEEPDHDQLISEALRRHQQALVHAPGHADLHYRYGLLLRQVGRHDDAIEAFREAVVINPNYSKAQIKLGICLKECGRVDEAIEAFQQALKLDTRFVEVHYQLGLLFAQRSQFDLAAEQFEHAVAGNGRNIAFRANLALALQNIGLVDRAAATWQAICDLSRGEDVLTTREAVLKKINRGETPE